MIIISLFIFGLLGEMLHLNVTIVFAYVVSNAIYLASNIKDIVQLGKWCLHNN